MVQIALSPAEAAAALGVGRTTLFKLIRSGEINAKKSGGRTIIPVAELQRFVDALPPTHSARNGCSAGGEA